MNDFKTLREECYEANAALAVSGLVDLTFGNASVLDRDAGVFAIKPSGVRYENLTPDAMVVVDLDGEIVSGEFRPSSDTPTHRCLFRAFGAIRSVVHTHSRRATAFAQAGRDLPAFGTTHADFFAGPVPVTRQLTPEEINAAYEWATGEVIVERFNGIDPMAIPAVLVRNHAPFAWGPDGLKAVETAFALEAVADLAHLTLAVDPNTPEMPRFLLEKHFFRKHGATAYYGQR